MAIKTRRKHTLAKPNVVPILDAVFIFIFFLLLSSEFLNIKEINTTMPIVKNSSEVPKDLNPLNLTILIRNKSIIVKTGLNLKVYKKIDLKNENINPIDQLGEVITNLKKQHPTETVVNIQPVKKVKFKEIIKIIDIIKNPSEGITGFNKIVFDSM